MLVMISGIWIVKLAKKKFRIPPKKRTFAILIISPDDRADIDR
jgi:hypothetical protein